MGLAGVHECFMTMSARGYVSGWSGTPRCATVAIINLGLSAGGQGSGARTGQETDLFRLLLILADEEPVHTSSLFREKSHRKTGVVAWRQQ